MARVGFGLLIPYMGRNFNEKLSRVSVCIVIWRTFEPSKQTLQHIEEHTVFLFSAKMAEIHLKTVECAQFHFRHRLRPKFIQFDRNLYMVGFSCDDLGEIRPVWKKSAIGVGSAIMGGGN
jgi:hypothetical protein